MKLFKTIQHTLDQDVLTTTVEFKNAAAINIYTTHGMIYVADCSYAALQERIENDECDTFESYDTIDECDYYTTSEYHEFITSALLHLVNIKL